MLQKKAFLKQLGIGTMVGLLSFACTPQTVELEPTLQIPTLRPTLNAGNSLSDDLPTPVIEIGTHTPTHTPQPATPTPTATETTQPTETAVPTATATPLPTATATTSTSVDEPASTVRFAVVGVESDDVLNMRSGAGVENEVIGEIPYAGIGVTRTGEEEEVGASVWVEVTYGETTGWVNQTFLAQQFGEINPAADTASKIILALQEEDFATLATYVHPAKGVRFSPYAYVAESDVILSQTEIEQLSSNSTIYNWGTYDGEGGSIELTFAAYYDRFVYDVEFARPHSIGFDQFIGQGSMINNLEAFYPEASFVEYYFPGFDPDFGGLDWRSLRLVMEEVDGKWVLVGIVHSEWTT